MVNYYIQGRPRDAPLLWLINLCYNYYRDALRQAQFRIELEYEEKIQKVLKQLESEKEGNAALKDELDKLREQKLNASLRYMSESGGVQQVGVVVV